MDFMEGCQVALCPAKGNTGAVMTDYSPYHRDGVIVNADPGAWAERHGYMTFRTNGTTTAVNIDFGSVQAYGDATVAMWLAVVATRGEYERYADFNFARGGWIGRNGSTGQIGGAFKGGNSPYGAFVDYVNGTFVHLCITRIASGLNALYINGSWAATYSGDSGLTDFRVITLGQDAPGVANLEPSQIDIGAFWVWQGVKSAEMIAAHAVSPLAPFDAPPTAFPFWRQRSSGLLMPGL